MPGAASSQLFQKENYIDEGGVVSSCGGAGGMCFEPGAEITSTSWQFMGDGKGAYERIQNYAFVGDSHGSYEKETTVTVTGYRCRWCCLALLCVLFAGFVAGLLYWFWLRQFFYVVETEVRAPVTLTPSSAPYDCNAGLRNWQSVWSVPKQAWCCQHFTRGCAPATTSLPFDCTLAFFNWQKAWSPQKKSWCCLRQGRGCPEQQPHIKPLYSCHGDAAPWATGKKMWCCTHYQIACPSAATTSLPFDCQAGLSNWQAGWSAPKKAWCCAHESLGCKPRYDCTAGYSNWRQGWSFEKKGWCCQHASRGCPPATTTLLSYDCVAGFSHWHTGWSSTKKRFCCAHTGRACYEPFDCDAGFSNWQKGWSDAKKIWCCKHTHRGCGTVSTPYDCHAGLSNWQAGWSDSKKSWCCHHFQLGCGHTASSGLGCSASCELHGTMATCKDRIQFSARHSFAHQPGACGKAYRSVQTECDTCAACQVEEVQCQELPVSYPYDCDAGFSNWRAGWSARKKHWCCQTYQKGCTNSAASSSTSSYTNSGSSSDGSVYSWKSNGLMGSSKDQTLGSTSASSSSGMSGSSLGSSWVPVGHPPSCPPSGQMWRWMLVDGQYRWHLVVIVGSLPFDCEAGYSNWRRGWSEDKKDYCCEHFRKGCT